MMNSPLLKLDNFNVYTFDKSTLLLQSLCLSLEANQFYIVLGDNGAGKSTLLLALQQEVNRFYIEGERAYESSFIPLLPQQIEHYFVGQTAWEEFVLTWESQLKQSSTNSIKQMQDEISEVVALLNIKAILHMPLQELSGGQLQLIALASTLLMKASIILIDEMTAMVDQATRRAILKQIRHVQAKTRCTIIYVTHDERELMETDKVLLVSKKEVYSYTYSEWTNRNNGRLNGIEGKPFEHEKHRQVLLNKSMQFSTTKDILHVNHIKLSYSTTLPQQRFTFFSGVLTIIKGENGAGKSSLLKAIAGELLIVDGTIQTNTSSISRSKKIGSSVNLTALKCISYCPQFLAHYWSKETVMEECLYVSKCYRLHHILTQEQLDSHIHMYLSYFNIDSSMYNRRLYTLSAGQQKRIALALCFMVEQKWMVLDEPYAYLDMEAQNCLTTLIENRVGKGCGIILVTHEQKQYNVEHEFIHIEKHDTTSTLTIETQQGEVKEGVIENSFHPLMLLLSITILGLIIFIFGNYIEVGFLLAAIALVMTVKLKRDMIKMFKFISIYSLYMCVIGVITAFDFTSYMFNAEAFITFMQYALKLIVLLLLSYPLMLLISPFKLMRVLQQARQRMRLKAEHALALYTITIIFRFMTLLQLLWGKLTSLYRVKYKKRINNDPYSFFVHYLRECLLIAESIIINYELRKPLNLSSFVYKVKLKQKDVILFSSIAIISMLILFF